MNQDLWESAQGDDLPEYDREVIALEGIINQNNYICGHRVVFAHRPNPDGWNSRSVLTGKVEHYTPKTYDKGGWNIPNIVWWLDTKLPEDCLYYNTKLL